MVRLACSCGPPGGPGLPRLPDRGRRRQGVELLAELTVAAAETIQTAVQAGAGGKCGSEVSEAEVVEATELRAGEWPGLVRHRVQNVFPTRVLLRGSCGQGLSACCPILYRTDGWTHAASLSIRSTVLLGFPVSVAICRSV